ncbi:hypothetical protein M6B38_167740 [Iris pallida]|uniref:Uncharacterized protein n=1 Tax=Iris pallida TaxID=29817 RepID=A0AAX6EW42_IRIPA|nr:hypothetical protein M6B38_167740 [Iris pallida]
MKKKKEHEGRLETMEKTHLNAVGDGDPGAQMSIHVGKTPVYCPPGSAAHL